MIRSRILRLLPLLALAGLFVTASGEAQIVKPKPAEVKTIYTPKFEAVAETRLLMEGLAHSNYRSLQRLLKTQPGDNETWVFARGQAILLAETGNLLLLRPPRNVTGRDAWFKLASGMRSEAITLARQTAARDYPKSKAALANLTASCNRCHDTFRVKAKIGPEVDMGERDAE